MHVVHYYHAYTENVNSFLYYQSIYYGIKWPKFALVINGMSDSLWKFSVAKLYLRADKRFEECLGNL